MLVDLRVRSLGVIEDVLVRFGPGMTAVTGETGAGKTLLVEALQLLLGQRADPGLVRGGAEEATVEGRFLTDAIEGRQGPPDRDCGGALRGEDAGDDELIVTRTIPASGRSRCQLNGHLVPLTALSELGPQLVDIHGQQDQQSLMTMSGQRRLLDDYGCTNPARVDTLRRRAQALGEELHALGGERDQRAREIELLRHQITEIDAAGLEDPDEERRLAEEEAWLSDLARHQEMAAGALRCLDPDLTGSEPGALDALGSAVAALIGAASDTALSGIAARLRALAAEVADVASELRAVLERGDDDPDRLAAVQQRRRLLADLHRKYGGSREATLAFRAQASARLAMLEEADHQAQRITSELERCQAELAEAEGQLRAARSAAAPRLGAETSERLRDLALPGARLEISVGADAAGDEVTFLFSANPGQPLRPLARVASGGELARAMLALRLVAVGGPPTMVFDEVDAGVGGKAALALAQALAEVAADRQVLVVTHLPQVAAFADHQIVVRKRTVGSSTVTEAFSVSGTERIVELSRMLSGHPDSATARAHADELLKAGRAFTAARRTQSTTTRRVVD